jgi:hypothetical protein
VTTYPQVVYRRLNILQVEHGASTPIAGTLSFGSIEYVQGILKKIDKTPKEVEELRLRREDIALAIYANIRKLADTYRQLYAPVQRFIEQDEWPAVCSVGPEESPSRGILVAYAAGVCRAHWAGHLNLPLSVKEKRPPRCGPFILFG